MTVLGYILDGLEAELALERELGVRGVEIDRELLAPPAPPSDASPESTARPAPIRRPDSPAVAESPPAPPPPPPPVQRKPAAPALASAAPQPPAPPVPAQRSSAASKAYDFVFLHDRPLTGAGAEMISKITMAMGRTDETAPVVVEGPRPDALIYVVLGDRALKKWFPGTRAGPGMWITGSQGEEALVTYSPNYFLRFGEVTPAVRKIKSAMWQSLKGVLQRLALKRR